MFRPQSLKQLMPTIDEQIMKLTDMAGSINGIQNQGSTPVGDQASTQVLFKALADSNQSSLSRSAQVRAPLNP